MATIDVSFIKHRTIYDAAKHRGVRPLSYFMKRVSFILSSLWLSGGVRVVIEYANHLAREGNHVRLVVPRGAVDKDIVSELASSIAVVESKKGRKRDKAFSPFAGFGLAASLARAVPQSDILISTHTPTTAATLLATRFVRKAPKAAWLYQDYMEMFTKRPAEQWLVRNAGRWHQVILTISRSAKKELDAFYSNVVVVGEGLSHARHFTPVYRPRPSRRRNNILYLGDMRPRKGLQDFLQAAGLVREKLEDIRLTIVSKDKCEINTPIPSTFVYRPSRRQLAGLYQSCDLFVSASWWESFGLPPLEAMACAAPVVTTNSRGVLEYAKDGENCLVTPIKNPEQLAAAMLKVLTSPSLAAHLSRNGPPTAKAFSWEKAAERFVSCLNGENNA